MYAYSPYAGQYSGYKPQGHFLQVPAGQKQESSSLSPAATKRIHDAAVDFEAVYLGEMLKPMFETVEVDSTFGGGSAEETWRGMLVEEYAKSIAKGGGIGLASSVEKEMLKLQEMADGK